MTEMRDLLYAASYAAFIGYYLHNSVDLTDAVYDLAHEHQAHGATFEPMLDDIRNGVDPAREGEVE